MNNIFASKFVKLKYIPTLLAAYICALVLLPFLTRKKYVIGGHAGELFDDNGRAFYEYLLDKKRISPRNVIWYTDGNESLPKINTRKIGSFKGYLAYFTAKCALYTHSSSTDIAPLAFHLRFRRPIRIYLDHGIDGLKKVGWTSKIEPADGYVVASPVGREIKAKYWHLDDSQIIDTGLARYDQLFRHVRRNDEVKRILYLPTWREWNYGMSHAEFEQSDYFKAIISLLKDEGLQSLLQKNKIMFHVELHPFCREYLVDFKRNMPDCANIELSFGNISNEIIKADMLVTDYSSVCWDFLYQNKLTLFYQFDQQKYLQTRGSYLDLNRALFGPVLKNKTGIVKTLIQAINSEIQVSQATRHHYFSHIDNHNCDRVYSEIERLTSNEKID